jgi:thioredoxin reductase (NADPH)
MAVDPFDTDAAFPRLGEEVLAVLDAAGERRPLATGDILCRAGDPASDFFVVLRGRVAVIDGFESPDERVIGVHGELRFVGELNLVTGQPAFLTAVVKEPGEAIVLTRDQLRAVVSADQQLGDVIVNAFIARRALLIGLGTGLRLIGSHLAPDTRRLREFLTRNRIPHTFLDAETDPQADLLLRWLSIGPRETPLLLGGAFALRR